MYVLVNLRGVKAGDLRTESETVVAYPTRGIKWYVRRKKPVVYMNREVAFNNITDEQAGRVVVMSVIQYLEEAAIERLKLAPSNWKLHYINELLRAVDGDLTGVHRS